MSTPAVASDAKLTRFSSVVSRSCAIASGPWMRRSGHLRDERRLRPRAARRRAARRRGALGEDDRALAHGVDLDLGAVDASDPFEELVLGARQQRPQVLDVVVRDLEVLHVAEALLEAAEDRELAAEGVLPEVQPARRPERRRGARRARRVSRAGARSKTAGRSWRPCFQYVYAMLIW